MKISWEDRKELVRRYIEDGVPAKVLAQDYGVGVNTVYIHLYAAGVKGQRGFAASDETKRCVNCGSTKPLGEFQPGYKARCRDCHKQDRFNRGYNRNCCGVKADDFARLLADQNGKCALCGVTGKLVADHDHNTGIVRGLLCYRCNARIMGLDDPDWLARALEYQKRDTGVRWSPAYKPQREK